MSVDLSSFFSVPNDDQYASNVPDTLDHLAHRQQQNEEGGVLFAEDSKLDSRDGHEDTSSPTDSRGNRKVVEIRYLSQLRRSPFPINGVYKLRHHTAHNHFRRYADVKHRGELKCRQE